MEDYAMHTAQPWYAYADQITKVRVLEGVTGISDYAFTSLPNLTQVELPEGLTRIGSLPWRTAGS